MDCRTVNEVTTIPVLLFIIMHDNDSKLGAVMNGTLANPAVCLWGISVCSLNHLRAAAHMIMDITAISKHI